MELCPANLIMKNISILSQNVIGENDRFWAASGLDELFAFMKTEAGEYLTNRMQEKGTCRYVRNHFTLNREIINGVRCGGDVYAEDAAGLRRKVLDTGKVTVIVQMIGKSGMLC